MDLQAEKSDLLQQILNINDIGVIKKVKNLLKKQEKEHDWFDELSEEQQQSVLRGLEQADRGETISHEEAMLKLGL